MHLDRYSSVTFDRGASRLREALWLLANGFMLSTSIPGSIWRVLLLRAFGAIIGRGVIIKPSVRVKFPWRLQIGSCSWIGESVWIDNLADVRIGSNVCISQGAYFCTGSHDWNSDSFELITKPTVVADHCWIGAKSILAPGAQLGIGSVLCMASLAKGQMSPWTIYSGIPALPLGPRRPTKDMAR
jgi:putative colanic acid biosynthesis acetyltransferase WcaF